MNTEYPHDIKDFSEIPVKKRGTYLPLTQESYNEVKDMTPEERAAWVIANPLSAKLMIKAQLKRDRKAALRKAARGL